MPKQVDDYFKQVKQDNPTYSDEQAWATAWSIYCKHKNPGSEHCHKPTEEYLKGKNASSIDNYFEYLKSIDFEIDQQEIAAHRNFLQMAEPLMKGLNDLIGRYENRSFKSGGRFTDDQVKDLIAARNAIRSALVPFALLKEKAPPPILRMPKKASPEAVAQRFLSSEEAQDSQEEKDWEDSRGLAASASDNKAKLQMGANHPLNGQEVEIVREDPFQRFVVVRVLKKVGDYKKGDQLNVKPSQIER